MTTAWEGNNLVDKKYLDRLSQWDTRVSSLAPLSDTQKESVVELNTYTERNVPEKFKHKRVRLSESISQDDYLSRHIASLDLGTRKIENAQQFFSWFSQVQVQMEEEQEKSYRTYQSELLQYILKCDLILKEVRNVVNHLSNLEKQQLFVSTQTRALHDACEQSLQDQANLMDQAESISNRLAYFNTYESLKHRLNSSTLSVTGESFLPLLKKIDESLAYIEDHPDYKESAVYAVRFKQCLTQALSLVKSHVTNILRNTANQALQALQKDSSINFNDSSYTALYGKFKTQSMRVKNIMEQIEERSGTNSEYETLISDCQQCYLEYRWQLISPFVADTIQKLTQQHARNPCTLFRSGCSFMVHVCQDEYQLYHEFFSQEGKSNFDTLMENLCGVLYEAFRPLIIQMTHMETLSEICNILKVEMLEDHVQKKPQQLSSFQVIISDMLEDVQERLVYRTQAYISKDIAGYAPSPGDLAYPDKLMMDIGSSDEANDDDEKRVFNRQENQTAIVDLQAMWYPTVRRTLVCLSKLYNCIGKPTFEGIAHEALASCIVTLRFASKEITNKKGAINGHLFLIKHLLILREQITPFDVDFAVKEVALDFTKLKTAAYGLFFKGSKLLSLSTNNAILEFILEGVPQLTEYYIDSKKEVDSELKLICEQFITDVTDSYAAPLITLLDKMDTILKMAEADGKDGRTLIRQQPFAKADAIRKVVSETYMLLKSRLPTTIQNLSLYLANKDTEYILFKPIKAKVLRTYKQLSTVVIEYYDEEDQQIIGCPSQEQVSLLMSFQ